MRNLTQGPIPRVVRVKGVTPYLFGNAWNLRAQPNPGGAAVFAYATEMRAPIDLLGASYHAPRHPSPLGSPPMVAQATVQRIGIQRTAGTTQTTPLSRNLPA